MLQSILYSIFAVFIYMTTWFFIALIKKDNSIVDIAWGLGYVLINTVNLLTNNIIYFRQILFSALVLIWAVRLSLHIYIRNKGKGEDFRYKKWRKDWGDKVVLKSFINIFMLQGFFMLIIAYPIILVHSTPQNSIHILDIIGMIIWLFGFLWETIGDYQLLQFKKNQSNKGKIMISGLWKFSRHPNYFGEAVIWWGFFMFSLSATNGWTAIVSPIVMTLLLDKVSGVPMLEKKYKDNPEFITYSKRTSRFIPWFPKK